MALRDRGAPMTAFDVYQLTEEHQAIREAVRAVCEGKVAPNAAAADETGEFPQASFDALATAIVIEEIARVCTSSSLIPGVNKLGTMPLLLAGSAEVKQQYLPPVARGDAMFSYCLSEPE